MSTFLYQSGSSAINTYNIVTASGGVVTVTNSLTIPGQLAFGSLASASQAVVRSYFSASGPITYNNSTGVFSINFGTPGTITPDTTPAAGSASTVALSDHVHGFLCNPPSDNISSTLREGTSSGFSRSDHGHIGVRSMAPSTSSSSQVFGDILINAGSGITSSTSGQTFTLGVNPTAFPVGIAREFYVLQDVKGNGVGGGTYSTASTWLSRVLNTLYSSGGANVALQSSSTTNTSFVVQPGTFYLRALAGSYSTGNSKARMYNSTSSAYAIMGSTYSASGISIVEGVITLSSATTFVVQTYGTTANTNSTALGYPAGDGVAGEMYTTCQLIRIG